MRAWRMASAGDSPSRARSVGARLDVKAHLVAHLALETIATHEHAGERTKTGHMAYTSSGVALSAVPMADASLFHSAVSSRRRRRPAVVSV